MTWQNIQVADLNGDGLADLVLSGKTLLIVSHRERDLSIVDNVVRDGAIVDADSTDEGVQGVRRFNDLLKKANLAPVSASSQ